MSGVIARRARKGKAPKVPKIAALLVEPPTITIIPTPAAAPEPVCNYSNKILVDARDDTAKILAANGSISSRWSVDCREHMSSAFENATGGKQPYQWQLDVAEALLLGRDCTVIAPTGSGKTIPPVLPLLAAPKGEFRMMLVISPLKELQNDQVRDKSTYMRPV
jgi:ATP-dependent helicase YprA (DUF1998 family)